MLFYRFYAALAGLLHGNHCYFKYLIDIELTNTETEAVTL